MKRLTHIMTLIFLSLMLSQETAQSGTCSGGTKTFTENFSTSAVYRNGSASTEAGWTDLTGEIRLPSVASGYTIEPPSAPDFLATLWNYRAVDSGDFDGDGKDDLIVAGSSGAIAILTQSSAFSVTSVTNSDSDTIWDVVASDFDSDGDVDFTTIDANGQVRRWDNDGSMNFSVSISFTNSYASNSVEKSVSLGRHRDNGRDDNLFIGHLNKQSTDYYIRVYLNNTSNFVYYASNDINPGDNDERNIIAVGDLDGNSYDDLLVVNYGNNRDLMLMLTDGSGNFTAPSIIASIDNATDIEIVDWDGDGDLDFLTGTDSSADWYENDGAANFTKHNIFVGDSVDLAVGDLNDDGAPDAFFLDMNAGDMKWVISQTSGYATSAVAQSVDIAEPLPAGAAIDSATITTSPGDFLDLRGCNPGFNTMDPGSCIKYFLTNVNPDTNPGSWEQFDPGTSGLFTTSGNELYFKVEFEGDGATTSTVNNLTIEYGYSGDRYIYRAESVVDKQSRVLIQGSFKQGTAPSEGMIEPYDLTVMPPDRLIEIKGGAGDFWNGTRTVYTSDGSGNRVDYTSATAGGLTAAQVSDVKALALGGIDHSAPVAMRGVVFPSWYYLLGNSSPTEKAKFDAFRAANHNRTTHWFIGAGDGMMHALDGEPETSSGLDNPDFGKELWAYVPYAYRSSIINNTDIDPSNDVQVDVPGTLADCYDPRLGQEKFRSLLVFPLDGDLNEIVCLDVTDPVNPEVMWEFSSAAYDNLRGVLAMGRILGDAAGDPKGRFVVFGISAVPFPGDIHPVTSVPGPGYTVRIFVLDAITGALIKDFPIYYPTTLTNYAPPGPSVADRDKDGYLDIIFYPDLYGDLQIVSLGSRIAGTFQIAEDEDPNSWTQETFYQDIDPTFDDLAFGYSRVAVGHATNGDLLAFYGTAGDNDNRFYAICVMGTCTEKDPVFIVGDNESYLQQERVIASPVVINNNVFFFGTGNEYIDGGTPQPYGIDQILPCSVTPPLTTLYAVKLGLGGTGTDIDGVAHVVTKQIEDTAATPQAVGESVVGVTKDGDIMVEGSPFSEGSEGGGIGDKYIRILGWIEVF